MFRKLIAILTLLVYIPAIAGVGFSTHYCGGEAGKTKVFSVAKQSCCCGEPSETEEEDGCCSDDIRFVKLDKDQLGSAPRLWVKTQEQAIPVSFSIPVLQLTGSFIAKQNPDPSPPFVPPVKRCVLHNCFLI